MSERIFICDECHRKLVIYTSDDGTSGAYYPAGSDGEDWLACRTCVAVVFNRPRFRAKRGGES